MFENVHSCYSGVLEFVILAVENLLGCPIQLPTQDQLKTVVDKVKDFFGSAKESFGKLTTLNLPSSQEEEETSAEKSK